MVQGFGSCPAIQRARSHRADSAPPLHADCSYYALVGLSVEIGIPGTPELRDFHLRRDATVGTLGSEYQIFALPSLVQSRLIARGCLKVSIGLSPDIGPNQRPSRPEFLR